MMMLGALGTQEEVVLIPKDAIRFRVIAASDKEKDQTIKKKVAKGLHQWVWRSLNPRP